MIRDKEILPMLKLFGERSNIFNRLYPAALKIWDKPGGKEFIRKFCDYALAKARQMVNE